MNLCSRWVVACLLLGLCLDEVVCHHFWRVDRGVSGSACAFCKHRLLSLASFHPPNLLIHRSLLGGGRLSFCVVHPLSDGECGRGFGSMTGKTLQGSLATSWELCLAILHRRVDARCGARSPFLCLSLCFLLVVGSRQGWLVPCTSLVPRGVIVNGMDEKRLNPLGWPP